MSNHAVIGCLSVFICLQLVSLNSVAQARERKGYLAVTAGPGFLVGDHYETHSGIQLTLLEFGYEFSRGIGVSASWLGAAFRFESTAYYSDGSAMQPITAQFQVGYGMLVAGPMYSIKTGSNSSLDLKAKAGRYFLEEKIEAGSFRSASQNTSVGYLISATYQKRLSNWWTFLASIDYGSGKKPVTMDSYERINSLAATIGIGLRL